MFSRRLISRAIQPVIVNRRSFIRPSSVRLNEQKVSSTIEQDQVVEEIEIDQDEQEILEYNLPNIDSDSISTDPLYNITLSEAIENIKNSDIEQNPKLKEFNSLLHDIVFRHSEPNTSDNTSKITASFPFLERTGLELPYSEQELYLRTLYHRRTTGKLGSQITKVYRPQKDIKNPDPVNKIAINTLMSAGCHLGHSTSLWRPSTQPFIYGEYKGIHIIDLDQTLTHLKKAAKIVEGVAERNGIIVFVGTRKGQRDSLIQAANRTGGFYVASKWIQGTITNATKTSESWSRKEVDMEDINTNRELDSVERNSLVKPDLIVILNPTENRRCIKEAILTRIPTIGLVDTDSEPSLLTYAIPCNDDSLRATNLITGVLSKAGEAGRLRRLERIQEYKKSLGVQNEGVSFAERI